MSKTRASNLLSIFLILTLLGTTSCSTMKFGNWTKDEKVVDEKIAEKKTSAAKTPEEKIAEEKEHEKKAHNKKFLKEAGRMVVADIVIAAVCEAGLDLSFGICLAVSVASDLSIIVYSNLEMGWEEDKEREMKIKEAKLAGKPIEEVHVEKKKRTPLFEPFDFAVSLSLTVLSLLLF